MAVLTPTKIEHVKMTKWTDLIDKLKIEREKSVTISWELLVVMEESFTGLSVELSTAVKSIAEVGGSLAKKDARFKNNYQQNRLPD